MRFIDEMFTLKPVAVFSNFITGEKFVAEEVCVSRQVSECPKTDLLPYEEDPVFISVCAVVTGDHDDLVFTDTNMPVSGLVWEGPDGNVYITDMESVEIV